MDRNGFKNRMQQYKKAREENPGLKYWEWKDIPKYDEGTDGVKKTPHIPEYKGLTYAEMEQRLKKDAPIEYNRLQANIARNTQSGEIVHYIDANGNKRSAINAKGLEIVSPEFEILSGGIGIPRLLYENRITNLAKSLVSKSSDKTLSKGATKIKPHFQLHTPIGETFTVSEDAAKELSAMYHRNISSETAAILSVLGKKRTPSRIQFNLNASEREWLRKHNVDETILSGKDIKTLKQLRRQSIIDATPINERFILTSPTAEHSQLQLFKNTLNKPTQIGYIEYGTDPYSYMSYLGRHLLPISDIDLTNHVTVDMIENISNGLEKGVSKDLYNGLAHVMKQRFPENGGFVTGMKLLSPEPTTKTLNKLNKSLISNLGEYHWATGSTLGNPIYSITNTTGDYPVVKSLLFDPKAIKNGKIITDLTNPDIHFADGGEVEPDPLEVLERSRPKVVGIPINDPPIESVFSPWDIALGTSYRLMPFVNKVFPNYGPALGTLVLGDAATSNKLQPLITKKLDPDVSEFYKDVVIPMNPNDEVYKQYFMKQFGNPNIEIHPVNNLPNNFAADYNPNTNKIRVREDYMMSPNYQQLEAHEYGHLLDKYLPYDETTQQVLNNSLKVPKTPISKDSDTYRERLSTKREAEFKAFLNLKKAGKMKVKTSRAKTKRYQEYLANASDEEILELLGADTAYKQDYLAGNIDIDTLRLQMMYAPTIAAGLIVPEHLLKDDKEEKQWT